MKGAPRDEAAAPDGRHGQLVRLPTAGPPFKCKSESRRLTCVCAAGSSGSRVHLMQHPQPFTAPPAGSTPVRGRQVSMQHCVWRPQVRARRASVEHQTPTSCQVSKSVGRLLRPKADSTELPPLDGCGRTVDTCPLAVASSAATRLLTTITNLPTASPLLPVLLAPQKRCAHLLCLVVFCCRGSAVSERGWPFTQLTRISISGFCEFSHEFSPVPCSLVVALWPYTCF